MLIRHVIKKPDELKQEIRQDYYFDKIAITARL